MTRARDGDGKPGQGGFASRWSQRKQAAKAAPPELAADVAPPAEAPDDERPDAEVLEELGLPDPDKLEPGDDFSGFMAKAVPARLRQRALRRLWVSDPVYANLDNLVDYAEDFTYAGNVAGALRTAYQVGKGFADAFPKEDETAEPASDRPEDPRDVSAAEQDPDPESTMESSAPASPGPDPAEDGGAETDEIAPLADASGATMVPRVRMRFRMVED